MFLSTAVGTTSKTSTSITSGTNEVCLFENSGRLYAQSVHYKLNLEGI